MFLLFPLFVAVFFEELSFAFLVGSIVRLAQEVVAVGAGAGIGSGAAAGGVACIGNKSLNTSSLLSSAGKPWNVEVFS